MNFIPYHLLVRAKLLALALSASAVSADIVFPADASVINVRTAFGAVGDGVADDTAALQAGIDASTGVGGDSRVLYIPNGTYRVTNTLVITRSVGPWIYGQSRDGVIIKLDDGLGALNPALTSVLRTYYSDTETSSADHFMRNIRHLTIHVGNNPTVDGIRWFSNNTGILQDIRVMGFGKYGIYAGFVGQSGPSLVQDVLVDGFDKGIVMQWSWGQTISRATIRNCRTHGVYVTATSVAIEDLVTENTPIALYNDYPNDWTWWGGVVALVGGNFSGSSPLQPAIYNRSHLYARNITSTGHSQIITSTSPAGDVTTANAAEYVSNSAVRLFADSTPSSLGLPIQREPIVPWETDLSKWLCIDSFGAIAGDGNDDTAAFQAAIDAAAAANQTVVYLRGVRTPDPNWHIINGEVRVHGSVKLVIGLGFGRVITTNGAGKFVVDETSAPVVEFRHIQAFGATSPVVENRSLTNIMFIQGCDFKILGTGSGDIFATDCVSRVELRNPTQSMWARQLNPEGTSELGLIRNHGAKLWVMGLKYEGAGVRFRTDTGGKSEAFGMFNYGPGLAGDDMRPAFEIDNASFSIAGVREINFGGNAYNVKARELRGSTEERSLGGGWIGWPLYSAWNAATLAAPVQAARPLLVPEGQQFLTNVVVSVLTPTPDSEIRFTLDGSEPTATSPQWLNTQTFTSTTTVKAKAFKTGIGASATRTAVFERLIPRPAAATLTPSSGLAYQYYETGPLSAVPDFSTLTPQKSGTVVNFDLSPRLRNGHISFRFAGYFIAPVTGIYQFYTVSDDGSKLWIGDSLVVDNDGIHPAQERSGTIALEAGQHPITVGWFNGAGGFSLSVDVARVGGPRQPIAGSYLDLAPPQASLSGRQHALDYQYYEGSWRALPNFSALTPVASGQAATVSVAPKLRNSNYGLRFTGWIKLPTDGIWKFHTTSDDGSKLYLDNRLVVDNDFLQAPTERSGSILATAGYHAITVEFFQGGGGDFLSIAYEGPGVAKQTIPAGVLFRTLPPLEDLDGDGWLNFQEYAFGFSSQAAQQAGLPLGATAKVSGDEYLQITFNRRTDSPDILYEVESSGTLLAPWANVPISPNLIGVPIAMEPGVERITVRDPVPSSVAARRFLRVKITQQ